ncbi:hypothetical protein [Streptomyces sp. NPDC001811]
MDANRTFAPPLTAVDQASQACRDLGRELALAGCDLAVFSSNEKYIEADVVQGYASACTAQAPGRVVAYPPRHRTVDFRLAEGSHAEVRVVRDTSGEWEVAYYRTILACDGLVMVGGGQSTRIAGIVALAQQVPVVPVAAFGGGAGQVWVNLDKVRNDTDDQDIALLGGDWESDSAARLTACLLRQRERKAAREGAESRRGRRAAWSSLAGWLVAMLCIAASVAGLVIVGKPRPADTWNLTVLVTAPLLTAMSGAVVRNSFVTESGWPRAAVRGVGAGLVTVLLYVASQLLSVPELMDRLDARRLLFITIPLGFSAGFTFDLVYERLRSGAAGTPPPGSELLTSPTPSGGTKERQG